MRSFRPTSSPSSRPPRTPGTIRGPLALLLGACSLWAGCGRDDAAAPDERPDVVLILIDTLRPDHLPFHGFTGRNTAPFLTKLAARSTVFRRAFSTSSWTAPSTASVFTSLYPNQHGVVEGFFRHERRLDGEGEVTHDTIRLNRLPRGRMTLPELFRDAGYTTFGVGTNVNIGAEIGFDRGFDRFEKIDDDAEGNTLTSPEVFERVRGWRNQLRKDGPNFVYLHFNDVHGPHAGVEPWYREEEDETERLRSAYNSEITFLDKLIQQIFRRAEWDDAIVMVVSDHGQEFMEHGRTGHHPTLYRELVQVLMMVATPDRPGGTVVDDVNVSLIDVLPTLAELAGIPAQEGWAGTSLVPLLDGPGGPDGLDGGEAADALRDELAARPLFAHRVDLLTESRRILTSVIQGDWQLIRNTGVPGYQLFDFVEDPDNQRNAWTREAELAARLEASLQRFEELEPVEENTSVDVDMDDELYEQLQSLGYAGE